MQGSAGILSGSPSNLYRGQNQDVVQACNHTWVSGISSNLTGWHNLVSQGYRTEVSTIFSGYHLGLLSVLRSHLSFHLYELSTRTVLPSKLERESLHFDELKVNWWGTLNISSKPHWLWNILRGVISYYFTGLAINQEEGFILEYIHKEARALGAYHNIGVDNFSKGQRAEPERRGLGRSLRTMILMEAW